MRFCPRKISLGPHFYNSKGSKDPSLLEESMSRPLLQYEGTRIWVRGSHIKNSVGARGSKIATFWLKPCDAFELPQCYVCWAIGYIIRLWVVNMQSARTLLISRVCCRRSFSACPPAYHDGGVWCQRQASPRCAESSLHPWGTSLRGRGSPPYKWRSRDFEARENHDRHWSSCHWWVPCLTLVLLYWILFWLAVSPLPTSSQI